MTSTGTDRAFLVQAAVCNDGDDAVIRVWGARVRGVRVQIICLRVVDLKSEQLGCTPADTLDPVGEGATRLTHEFNVLAEQQRGDPATMPLAGFGKQRVMLHNRVVITALVA